MTNPLTTHSRAFRWSAVALVSAIVADLAETLVDPANSDDSTKLFDAASAAPGPHDRLGVPAARNVPAHRAGGVRARADARRSRPPHRAGRILPRTVRSSGPRSPRDALPGLGAGAERRKRPRADGRALQPHHRRRADDGDVAIDRRLSLQPTAAVRGDDPRTGHPALGACPSPRLRWRRWRRPAAPSCRQGRR